MKYLTDSLKPDIVIINLLKSHNYGSHRADMSLGGKFWEKAIQRKSNRYAPLINDISKKSFIVECFPLEFGARGIVNEETITELSELCTEHVQ